MTKTVRKFTFKYLFYFGCSVHTGLANISVDQSCISISLPTNYINMVVPESGLNTCHNRVVAEINNTTGQLKHPGGVGLILPADAQLITWKLNILSVSFAEDCHIAYILQNILFSNYTLHCNCYLSFIVFESY